MYIFINVDIHIHVRYMYKSARRNTENPSYVI